MNSTEVRASQIHEATEMDSDKDLFSFNNNAFGKLPPARVKGEFTFYRHCNTSLLEHSPV